MSGVPQVSLLWSVLFNIFINDLNSGTEYTLSKFSVDTKLIDEADMLERRDTIQRDLDTLNGWALTNLVKFNKAKCKVLHLSWDNPQYQYILRDEWIESNPTEKELRLLKDERLDMSQ